MLAQLDIDSTILEEQLLEAVSAALMALMFYRFPGWTLRHAVQGHKVVCASKIPI
jgi:hypothetical protein